MITWDWDGGWGVLLIRYLYLACYCVCLFLIGFFVFLANLDFYYLNYYLLYGEGGGFGRLGTFGVYMILDVLADM